MRLTFSGVGGIMGENKAVMILEEKNEKIVFPRWAELPEIDLYMDQLISFFEKKLAFLFDKDEKGVTSTMINNYVKHKLIMPPVKKKYSREHLAYLFVIITLKKAFTMSEIKMITEKMTANGIASAVYDDFCGAAECACASVFGDKKIPRLDGFDPLLKSVSLAVAYNLYSQKLIEE